MAEELSRNPMNPLRQLINFKWFRYNILGQTWYFILIFIVTYYIIQTGYQFDFYCSFVPEEHRPICDEWLSNKFTHLENFEVLLTRLVTFLMGFYVSMIARRWWDQVTLNI